MQWIKHHGRRTAYRKRARTTGPPVVFVHGSGATHEAWASQFAIANERPVVALDLSGHGASDPVPTGCPPGSEMLAVYVEDVVAVYQAVEADAIVGVSLGGAVALEAIAAGHITPAAAVVTGTAPQMPIDAALKQALTASLNRTMAELKRPGRLFADPTDELVQATSDAFATVGLKQLRQDFQTAAAFDLSAAPITVPTTVIAGAEDRLVPLTAQQRLATTLSQAGLVVLPNAAHLAMIEQPRRVKQAIRQALV